MEGEQVTGQLTRCIICNNEVEDFNFQLCDDEKCIEHFRDMYLQGC